MEILAVTKVESSCLLKADVYKSAGSRVSGNIRLEKFFPNKIETWIKSQPAWHNLDNRLRLKKKKESIFNYDCFYILISLAF